MLRFIVPLAMLLGVLAAPAHSIGEPAEHVAVEAPAGIGGSFALTDQDGKPFSSETLDGRPTALFFGFTSCPNVCPTTLYELADLRRNLGPAGKNLQVVMITVDPAVDTPDVLKSYLVHLGGDFIGLTGTPAEIAAAAGLFFVTHGRDADGVMRHSASVYLLDAEGAVVDAIAYGEKPDSALQKLRSLLN